MSLDLKILLRRSGTAHAIMAIALPVAALASMMAVANFMELNVELLVKLVAPGRAYIILNGSSATDSRLDEHLAEAIKALPYIDEASAEKLFWVNASAGSTSLQLLVRGVEDVVFYLEVRRAAFNGSASTSGGEAYLGWLASRALGARGELILSCPAGHAAVKVAGTFKTGSELDSELLMPLKLAQQLAGEADASAIRFTLKEGVNVDWALKEIASLIPEEARLVKAQQLQEFISDVSSQAVAFLGIWSLAVYAVVAASSYTVASRLAAESNREISTLICLGAERRRIFALLVSYTAIAALFGSALGVALGVAGSQAASTALAWLTPSVRVEPFLEPLQALQVCALTVASAVLGCAHPAAAAAKSCAPRGA